MRIHCSGPCAECGGTWVDVNDSPMYPGEKVANCCACGREWRVDIGPPKDPMPEFEDIAKLAEAYAEAVHNRQVLTARFEEARGNLDGAVKDVLESLGALKQGLLRR